LSKEPIIICSDELTSPACAIFHSFLKNTAGKSIRIKDQHHIEKAQAIIIYSTQPISNLLHYLTKHKLTNILKQKAREAVPILGIGRGMEILFTATENSRCYQGLNLVHGYLSYPTKKSTPKKHRVLFCTPHSVIKQASDNYAYTSNLFSIKAYNPEDLAGLYDQHSPAVIAKQKLLGIQFQPELNSTLGRQLIRDFLNLIPVRSHAKAFL
jgi:glutamine amidotransferase